MTVTNGQTDFELNPVASTFTKALQGKVALVTGASRNLGAGFAKGLATAGASVVVHYNDPSSQTDAQHVAKSIHDDGGEAICLQADLADMGQIDSLFTSTLAHFGALDIVVNNAGIMHKSVIEATAEADFDQLFSVNTKGAFFVMRAAAANLREGGSIVNIGTSLLGAFTGNYAAYSGSKAPLEDFSRALAKELGSRAITVNTVCPGPVDTSFLAEAETEDTLNWLASASTAGRLGTVADITPWIVFLATPAARWATGQTFFVNGGFATR